MGEPSKSKKPNFEKVEQAAVAFCLTYISGVIVSYLDALQGYCTPLRIPCNITTAILATFMFIFFLRIVAFSWEAIPKAANRGNLWIRHPKGDNLHLFSGSLHDDIFTLRFISLEWRYPLKKNEVFVNVPHLVPIHKKSNSSGQKLEWTEKDNSKPLQAKRFIPYEVDFLKLDAKKNVFWIKNKDNEKFKFPPGKYGFEIQITSNIFGRFKIENNIFLKEIGWQTSFQGIYVIVDYKGSFDISVRRVKYDEYKKNVWHKTFKISEQPNDTTA